MGAGCVSCLYPTLSVSSVLVRTSQMSKLTARNKRTAIVTAALVVVGGGAAFAYWTSVGTGTGSATTGSSTDFTIASEAPTGNPLAPGGTAQSIAFTVTNPGNGSQILQNVEVTVANADGSPWAVTGCSMLDYSVGEPAIEYGEIAPGGSLSGTVTLTMNNLASNQDACKDKTVPLHFAAS